MHRNFLLGLISLALIGEICLGADPLVTWVWRNPLPDGNLLNGIIYANGQFIAVGSEGTIITSTDGTGWSPKLQGQKFLFAPSATATTDF